MIIHGKGMSHDVSRTLEGLLHTVVLLQELQNHSLHPASYPMAVPGWGSNHSTHIHVVQTFPLTTSIHTTNVLSEYNHRIKHVQLQHL